uniref:Uncharacterized protein n=1 Tax=Trichogramma kaykai TaxID=54128 RepID=A0ABD2VXR0_9HYME
MRKEMDCEVEEERRKLLNKLYPLIRGWEVQRLPDLRAIFRPEEIDWLLVEAISDEYEFNNQGRFIKFVASTGYKGELEVDKDGKPLLRRTTLVHLAARLEDDD